jgi:hypothetical protein
LFGGHKGWLCHDFKNSKLKKKKSKLIARPIILSAIKDYFFGKKNLKENLAFISKIFDRKIFFWGIDCRIVIG